MFSKIKAVRVQKIIMSGSNDVIGTIKYNNLEDPKPLNGTKHLPSARPLFYNFSQYPTVNEIVYILVGPKNTHNTIGTAKQYYLPPLNIHGSPNHNALPNQFTAAELNAKRETGVNGYFREIPLIKPLLPYEGDVMVEGRFGNSIRFGSTISGSHQPNNWSNKGVAGNPITIIRNGQISDHTKRNNQNIQTNHILEDINEDKSSIYLCSNQQISNFQKAGIGLDNLEPSYKHML